MNTALALDLEANFDQVGKYAQDEINGFSEELIEKLIELALADSCDSWLDAMAGDGNLTRRMFEYCQRKRIAPPSHTTVLDYSKVQTSFAHASLSSSRTTAIWGDLINGVDRWTGKALPQEAYDTVAVKSGNHEIKRENQLALHSNIFSLLRPGGRFVNLGFVFDSEEERDEFLVITNVKDSLAGLSMLVENRYFMTRQELYSTLSDAGFTDIQGALPCHYLIRSKVAAKNYFNQDKDEEKHLSLQAAQIRARSLRRNGRIRFHREGSVMRLPAEITVARKAGATSQLKKIYGKYPYQLLKQLDCHRELMGEVVSQLPNSGRLLDLGCGPGLLVNHIGSKSLDYTGVDISSDFIDDARAEHGLRRNTLFMKSDLNSFRPEREAYDAVTLINVLYQEGINAPRVIENALAALKPGQPLIVTGPLSADGLALLMEKIAAQLERDGLLPRHAADFEKIKAANAKLLNSRANFWSLEGMMTLLQRQGATKIIKAHTDLYYQTGYFICASKQTTEGK